MRILKEMSKKYTKSKDRIRNECIHEKFDVVLVEDKMREN